MRGLRAAFTRHSGPASKDAHGDKLLLAALHQRRIALAAAAALATGVGARAQEAEEKMTGRGAPYMQCFSTAQTREQIESHRLADPFACMRAAAHAHNGEALGARLCRLDDLFIYEISVLRPDGRIVRLDFDAVTGKPHSGRKSE